MEPPSRSAAGLPFLHLDAAPASRCRRPRRIVDFANPQTRRAMRLSVLLRMKLTSVIPRARPDIIGSEVGHRDFRERENDGI